EFFMEGVDCGEFRGKRVLEVGSRYVNGSVRPLIERFCGPREYVGVDIKPGRYVDIVLPAEGVVDYFGPESFDVVISTEVIEHVRDWRLVINNMKAVLKKGGFIYITTRSFGFEYHAYPHDYWRYEPSDMLRIFRDFEILKLARDHEAPGIFLKARKPMNYKPIDLGEVSLYSIILGRRTKEIVDLSKAPMTRRLMLRLCESRIKWLLPGTLLGLITRRYCV
ncbi:class I SAM-dependent methyltransferase, partial [Caldivirga sp.]|uniref:class I SAM-dependent methyltransferase n=1 Tax=Caldivirga sp. TaxID=2080243 RepID=UPI003D0A1489